MDHMSHDGNHSTSNWFYKIRFIMLHLLILLAVKPYLYTFEYCLIRLTNLYIIEPKYCVLILKCSVGIMCHGMIPCVIAFNNMCHKANLLTSEYCIIILSNPLKYLISICYEGVMLPYLVIFYGQLIPLIPYCGRCQWINSHWCWVLIIHNGGS